MLISYNGLVKLVDEGVIKGAQQEAINGTTIDVRLGRHFKLEKKRCWWQRRKKVYLNVRESIDFVDAYVPDGGCLILPPGAFALAHTMEMFYLPLDVSAEFMLKSSIGRNALEHMKAGWCDSGWHDSRLTLEIKNMSQYHDLVIQPGMYIGQMAFHRHEPVPEHVSYKKRGRYNNDATVSNIKP